MASSTDFLECIVERLELWMLELGVVESEEVVHDNIACQCRERMSQVHGLLPCLKLLHTDGESVDVAVDDVNEVQNRTP